MINSIIQGHALQVLKTMPDNLVDCIITSPPYYGLRSYGTDPQVWDNHNGCNHVWETNEHNKITTYNKGFNERWGNAAGQRKQEVQAQQMHIKTGYCNLCNAWCGELGQMPRIPQTITKLVCNPLGRNKRTVWTLTNKACKEAHFAVFQESLIETPLKACCPDNGIVLDPFMGSGTVAKVALQQGKNYIGIELNPEYIEIANRRIGKVQMELIF